MKFTHGCIVTDNVGRLLSFYRDILQIEPQTYGEDYVEFVTGGATLSLYSLAGQERLAPGSIKPASNRSAMFEFQVDDVDKEYERLQEMDIEWIKPPTTQPWGNRSIYFRDPDGNLINFYTTI
jgi:catechol 2,3-dioxygenase-like lactoylglutathione lyase family enzyme